MNDHRERLERDAEAFLAAGGVIQAVDSSANAGSKAVPIMARKQLLSYWKRRGGNAMEIARIERLGGGS